MFQQHQVEAAQCQTTWSQNSHGLTTTPPHWSERSEFILIKDEETKSLPKLYQGHGTLERSVKEFANMFKNHQSMVPEEGN